MPFRNSVSIVASPRSRVGKTLLARLLVDFHREQGRAVEAFDVNACGALAEFVPALTTVSQIGNTKGQIALFDRLIADDGTTKVVDLGHESFVAFFALAEQIGFAEEAARRGIACAVLFIITPDATSVEAFRSLRGRFSGALLVPVHNEIFGAAPHSVKYESDGTLLARLPLLASGLHRYIEAPPSSFSKEDLAVAAPPVAYDALQQWLRRSYREFRKLDLHILLADLQSAIRLEL